MAMSEEAFREYLEALDAVDAETLRTRFYHHDFSAEIEGDTLDLDAVVVEATVAPQVDFAVGILGKDRKYFDTVKAELKGVKLKREWQQYSIDLKGQDLSRVKTPFAWTTFSKGLPVTFYLDDIQFE